MSALDARKPGGSDICRRAGRLGQDGAHGQLCKRVRDNLDIAAIANHIQHTEDALLMRFRRTSSFRLARGVISIPGAAYIAGVRLAYNRGACQPVLALPSCCLGHRRNVYRRFARRG